MSLEDLELTDKVIQKVNMNQGYFYCTFPFSCKAFSSWIGSQVLCGQLSFRVENKKKKFSREGFRQLLSNRSERYHQEGSCGWMKGRSPGVGRYTGKVSGQGRH